MNGDDLISRAAAIEAFDDERVDRNYGDVSPESVIEVIESIPAVDAVPVVFCKHCRKCTIWEDGHSFTCNEDEIDYYAPTYDAATFYCADGKRRDEPCT
jgi:hypothetical protein